MKVNYFLKEPLKTKSPVIAIMRYKGNRFKLTTGVSVEVAYWEKTERRARKVRTYTEHETINIQLDRFENTIKTEFLKAAVAGTIPNIDQLKQSVEVRSLSLSKGDPQSATFLEYFATYAETRNLKQRTALSYQTTARILAGYEKYIHHPLKFEDINIEFYNHFRRWALNTPRQTQTKPSTENPKPEKLYYSLNTFGTFIKHIKTIMRESGPEGDRLHTNTEFKHRKFIKEAEEADSIYLSIDELTRIHHLPLNYETVSANYPDVARAHINLKIEALAHTRALFLIGCYTALRISDFSRLELTNISDRYIRIKPKKGTRKNEDVIIPIHPVIAGILARGFDFKHIGSHQKLNEHVKELCQLAGITEPVSVVRTEGGRQITRTLPKYKLVASHTARRSGATNMFIAGVPTISIMKITGHRTERSFMRYIRISQEENARLMADHPFFKTLLSS